MTTFEYAPNCFETVKDDAFFPIDVAPLDKYAVTSKRDNVPGKVDKVVGFWRHTVHSNEPKLSEIVKDESPGIH